MDLITPKGSLQDDSLGVLKNINIGVEMKRALEGIAYFIISYTIGGQFINLSNSHFPFFDGKVFGEASFDNALIYTLLYISASIFFSVKFLKEKKITYCIMLILFYVSTSIIGLLMNSTTS